MSVVASPNFWDGHLITVASDTFADFSVQHLEQPHHQILTGPAVVAPYPGWPAWKFVDPHGTAFVYQRSHDSRYLDAPDWKDQSLRRSIVARLIRNVRNAIAKTEFQRRSWG
jgi:hypothetical protein